MVRAIGSDLAQTQVRIATSANADMLFHYWKVGIYILYLQEREGWGGKVIDKLSQAIRAEYPDKKGYSRRNIVYMCQFASAYPLETLHNGIHINLSEVETLFKQSAVTRTNWASHVILLNSRLPLGERYWYITQAILNGWSRNVLKVQLDTNLFARQISAKKVNNFSALLPQPQSDLANYLMKDPYIFDLMGQTEAMNERDIERQLVSHVTKYLLEMGNGFAFVAQQKHFQVGEQDFYADLILYNIPLHAYVVIELKATAFKPEYMGQLNFYINVVDDTLRG